MLETVGVVFIIGVIAVVTLEVILVTEARRIDAIAILCISVVAVIVLDAGAVWNTELESIGVDGIPIRIVTIISFDAGALFVTGRYVGDIWGDNIVRKIGGGRVFCV